MSIYPVEKGRASWSTFTCVLWGGETSLILWAGLPPFFWLRGTGNGRTHLSFGEGNGNPLQCSCLENPVDRGAWWAADHRVSQSQIRLSNLACIRALEREMATHCSVLAWRIPGTAEPGGLPSVGSHRVGHDWSDLAAAAPVIPSGRDGVCSKSSHSENPPLFDAPFLPQRSSFLSPSIPHSTLLHFHPNTTACRSLKGRCRGQSHCPLLKAPAEW